MNPLKGSICPAAVPPANLRPSITGFLGDDHEEGLWEIKSALDSLFRGEHGLSSEENNRRKPCPFTVHRTQAPLEQEAQLVGSWLSVDPLSLRIWMRMDAGANSAEILDPETSGASSLGSPSPFKSGFLVFRKLLHK